jgi:ABC-type Co2+ transport system permease subunit
MAANISRVGHYAKVLIPVAGYGFLTLFMAALSYLTYRFGGGFADWKSVVTIAALVAMIFVTGWLFVTSWRER